MNEERGKLIMLAASIKGGDDFLRLYRRLDAGLTDKELSYIAAEMYLMAGFTPAELKMALEARLAEFPESEIDRGAYAWLKDNHSEVF